jgi:hypothetical protein
VVKPVHGASVVLIRADCNQEKLKGRYGRFFRWI